MGKTRNKVKQWVCDRLGALSTEEYDEFVQEIIFKLDCFDEGFGTQDKFNRLVGDKINIKMEYKEGSTGTNMFG